MKNGIKEIARITGYSTSTVARALSGNGYCGAEKKEKILSIAKQLNYQSNSSAIALRSGCTKRILFCIPDICNIFYFKMIQGVIEVLENNGYYAMLYTTEKKLDKEIDMIRLLKQKFCDGMIMVSFDFCKENISAIRESGCPVVLTNKYDGRSRGTISIIFLWTTLTAWRSRRSIFWPRAAKISPSFRATSASRPPGSASTAT